MLSNSKRETVHFKISATAQCDEHHTGQSLVFKRLLGTGISALVSESLPVRINVEHHKHSCAQESAVVSTLCVMMALQPALPTSPGQWFVAAVSCAQNQRPSEHRPCAQAVTVLPLCPCHTCLHPAVLPRHQAERAAAGAALRRCLPPDGLGGRLDVHTLMGCAHTPGRGEEKSDGGSRNRSEFPPQGRQSQPKTGWMCGMFASGVQCCRPAWLGERQTTCPVRLP